MSNDSNAPRPDHEETVAIPTTSFEAADAGTTRPFDTTQAQVAEPAAPERRLRVATIVWGIIVASVGSAVIAWGQGLRFDVQLASIGVLAVAGALLVVSAVVRTRGKA